MTRSGGGVENGLWAELIHATGRDGEAYYIVGHGAFALLRERPERLRPFAAGGRVNSHGFTKLRAGSWEKHERCLVEWLKMLCGEPADLSTTGEDSLMGNMRDGVVRRAKDAARGTMDAVRDVADGVERMAGGGSRERTR